MANLQGQYFLRWLRKMLTQFSHFETLSYYLAQSDVNLFRMGIILTLIYCQLFFWVFDLISFAFILIIFPPKIIFIY